MSVMLEDAARRRIIEQAISFSTGAFATPSPVPGVKILYTDQSHPRTPVLYEPTIVIVMQGAKVGYLGDRTFRYDAERYLLLTVPLPFECETIASQDEPLWACPLGWMRRCCNRCCRTSGRSMWTG